MRATLIGHACWLIETEGGAVLTDPVLMDPFEEGTVTSCPARSVDIDGLPPLAAIIISHRHLDHYHLPSLARLDRSVPLLCPEDPFLLHGIRKLGFTDIRPLRAFEITRIGGLRILGIPSVSETFLELGCVLADRSGVLLNQVDTPLTGTTIRRIREEFGIIDVHLAMHASQNFTFFEGRTQDLGEIHATNLSAALAVGARVVVPGAAGFRFVDSLDWLNPHLFPISRERFARDLRRLAPDVEVTAVNPGDCLEVESGSVRCLRQVAPFARMLEEDTARLAHDPTQPVPALHDDNEAGYPADFLARFAEGYVGQVLPALIEQGVASRDAVVEEYRARGVVYRLEVVFPDGSERGWTFRFDVQPVLVEEAAGQPDVRKRIAASALADVCGGRRGCFWMRTRSRRASTLLSLERIGDALAVDTVEIRDLLSHLIILSKVAQKGEEQGLLEYYGLTVPPGLM
ncbi:MAG: UDP-MurNAc hydroxylase [Myxococcota bacterium]|jgi:UDP-MurNAc hydroxylase